MAKKVDFPMNPKNKGLAKTKDEWVGAESETKEKEKPKEPIKRLTVDVPESLHRTVKMECVAQGVSVSDKLREIIISHFKN